MLTSVVRAASFFSSCSPARSQESVGYCTEKKSSTLKVPIFQIGRRSKNFKVSEINVGLPLSQTSSGAISRDGDNRTTITNNNTTSSSREMVVDYCVGRTKLMVINIFVNVSELKRDSASSVDYCFNDRTKDNTAEYSRSIEVPRKTIRSKSVEIVLPTGRQRRGITSQTGSNEARPSRRWVDLSILLFLS